MVNGVLSTPPSPTQGPSPTPSTREGSIIYCLMWALVSCNYSLPLWEGWGGVRTPYSKKNFYISVCAELGGKSLYRQGSFLAWNQA